MNYRMERSPRFAFPSGQTTSMSGFSLTLRMCRQGGPGAFCADLEWRHIAATYLPEGTHRIALFER